jgi:hypothetical protein
VTVGRGVKCEGYRVIGPYCVLRCSSVVVGKGAFVRDCRGIGQFGVMCRVSIVNYLASGTCGGGRGRGGER